jgi:hypothetical protein
MPSTNQNESGIATRSTPPSKAQVLANVFALAQQFNACVEVFNLIHPSKEWDRAQKVALAKLGIQQGRLLIFGDAVGISSPPAHIAKHMVPSKPGLTNPDPTLPINFGVRDPRLDNPQIYEKVRKAINEIAGRPAYLSREELMEKYGMKSPKRFSAVEYPSLDTNRLEAFKEKYNLLQDLVRESGQRPSEKRGMSMTIRHWTVVDIDKFCQFVKTVRVEVDGLIALMGVKEQVDKCMKTDIRTMGWHPDLNRQLIKRDWHKLQLVREACLADYPEYIEVTDTALKYISEELKETGGMPPAPVPTIPAKAPAVAEKPAADEKKEGAKQKEKRPGLLSHLFRSRTKLSPKESLGTRKAQNPDEDARAASVDITRMPSRQQGDSLQPTRSKSMSAVPDRATPFDLDTKLEEASSLEITANGVNSSHISSQELDAEVIRKADTANSLIDRHDQFQGVGRLETKDAKANARDVRAGQ